jgi:hypothetical protein
VTASVAAAVAEPMIQYRFFIPTYHHARAPEGTRA